MREQDLADAQFFACEEVVVGGHQTRLPHGGGHLQAGQVRGFLGHAQRLQAGRDSARGNDHDFTARFAQFGDIRHQRGHAACIGTPIALHQRPAADFYDHASGGVQLFSNL